MGNYDLTGIRRGNSFRRIFRFKDGAGDPVDLTGSVLVFVAEAGAIRLIKSTADGSFSTAAHLGRSRPTLSILHAVRRKGPVERRIEGEETTLVSGCITVMDGINDDSGDH